MEDEGKLGIGSRFFKVLVSGFEQALRLPPNVSRLLSNGKIPEAAILVSRRGSWRVGVGQCSKGLLTFHGEVWDNFVQYHDLSIADFLVFEHTGNMHFYTLVFDSTACEKGFPMTSKIVKDKGSADHSHQIGKGIKRKQNQATVSYPHKKTLFQIKLQRYSVECPQPFLYIPSAVIKSNGLSHKTTATVRNPSGETWRVHLNHRFSDSRYRIVMTRGWRKFVEANKLKVGDTCVFELNHSPETSKNIAVMNVKFL